MAKLSGSQFKQIQDALLSAFGSREGLAMMVRFELDENLAVIAGGDTLSAQVFSLISWAESAGRVQALVAGARNQNPGNAALQALARDAAGWLTAPTSTPTSATDPAPLPPTQPEPAPATAPLADGYDVFISYSHKDEAWVRDVLLTRLEAQGLRVCIDSRDFDIGLASIVNMERAVERSRRTLLVLTPNWVASEWTGFESLMVQTSDPIGLRRRMIPLLRERCDLPPRIAMLTYADFTAADDRTLPWERLVRSLKQA